MKGMVLDHAGRYDEAVKAFDKALEIKPDYVKALHNKGNVLDHTGNVEAAVETYDRILAIQPDAFEVWNNKGLTLAKLPERRRSPCRI